MKFYYIYKSLAHPETNGYVNPTSLEERLMHVAEAKQRMPSGFRWIADNMNNDLKHAMTGGANNPEFIFDPAGNVVRMRDWSNPVQLRADLVELVGAVEKPTTARDVGGRFRAPAAIAATGVVPRVKASSQLDAIRVTPVDAGGEPYYVKLRAEAEPTLLDSGAGELYLGFHLDPLYNVHWNNLVTPIAFEVDVPMGISLTPARGAGPKVAVESDVDPREFLLKVDVEEQPQPIDVTIKYFACNDEQGWCKPVTQKFRLELKRDPDAGAVFGRGFRFGRSR